jgi:hypothetical protein
MQEALIQDAVDAFVEMSEQEDRTHYQLALLYIQITWWGDPEIYGEVDDYGKQVFELCQDMWDAEPKATRGGVFAEVLGYLQEEARDAIAYVREQADRVKRRHRAGKWQDAKVHWDVTRPRVVPMSRRIALKQKLQREERLESIGTGDNEDRSGNDDGGSEGEYDEYDRMEMDGDRYENDEYDEEGKEEAAADEYQYYSDATAAEDNDNVAAPGNGSDSGTDGKTNFSHSAKELQLILIGSMSTDDHKMTLTSNNGDVLAEISDLESSVYIKAFIQYWNDNPTAWRKKIDTWEQSHGIPGRSILHCLKREDGEELREMGDTPFRMSVHAVHATPNGHGK